MSIDLNASQFTCAMCHETFNKGRPDAEALEETRSYFGDVPQEELEVICDTCWNKIHPQRN